MKRIGEILQVMADAPEDELGRLLAEARASTLNRQGIAAGMSGRSTHPRAKGRHGDKATLARAGVNEKDGTPERPAKFREVGKRHLRDEGETTLKCLRLVVDNGRCRPAQAARRKPPFGAGRHLLLVVNNG